MGEKEANKRYYRKNTDLFRLLNKIKLWTSRTGVLHGIKSITEKGDYAEVTTHCHKTIMVRNSKKSRTARWLRNKWMAEPCKECRVPGWKLDKYSTTYFSQHYGSVLSGREKTEESV